MVLILNYSLRDQNFKIINPELCGRVYWRVKIATVDGHVRLGGCSYRVPVTGFLQWGIRPTGTELAYISLGSGGTINNRF